MGQLDLFGLATHAVGWDRELHELRRVELGDGPWLDLAPGCVSGHLALFDELARTTRWREESRPMYDRTVLVPRLVARLPDDGDGHPLLDEMRRALGERYGEDLARVSLALYRDGRDSVAWHGDTTARDLEEAIVATVSLGAPRRFLLRPTAGGATRAFSLGEGHLLVMGGTCQRTWRHSIPKVPDAAPRMAVMFRPTWEPRT